MRRWKSIPRKVRSMDLLLTPPPPPTHTHTHPTHPYPSLSPFSFLPTHTSTLPTNRHYTVLNQPNNSFQLPMYALFFV